MTPPHFEWPHHDDVAHLECVDRASDDLQRVEVGVGHDVGDVAMHEHVARQQANELVGRHRGCGRRSRSDRYCGVCCVSRLEKKLRDCGVRCRRPSARSSRTGRQGWRRWRCRRTWFFRSRRVGWLSLRSGGFQHDVKSSEGTSRACSPGTSRSRRRRACRPRTRTRRRGARSCRPRARRMRAPAVHARGCAHQRARARCRGAGRRCRAASPGRRTPPPGIAVFWSVVLEPAVGTGADARQHGAGSPRGVQRGRSRTRATRRSWPACCRRPRRSGRRPAPRRVVALHVVGKNASVVTSQPSDANIL